MSADKSQKLTHVEQNATSHAAGSVIRKVEN